MSGESEQRRSSEEIQNFTSEMENIAEVLTSGGYVDVDGNLIEIRSQRVPWIAPGSPIQISSVPPLSVSKRTLENTISATRYILPAQFLHHYYNLDGSFKNKDESLESLQKIIVNKVTSLRKEAGILGDFNAEIFWENAIQKVYEEPLKEAFPQQVPQLTSIQDLLVRERRPREKEYADRDTPLLAREREKDKKFSPKELEQIQLFMEDPGNTSETKEIVETPGIHALRQLLKDNAVSTEARRVVGEVYMNVIRRLTSGGLFMGTHAISPEELSEYIDTNDVEFSHGISVDLPLKRMTKRGSELHKIIGSIQRIYLLQPHFAREWKTVPNSHEYGFISRDGTEFLIDRSSFLWSVGHYVENRLKDTGYSQTNDYKISPDTISRAAFRDCIWQEEQRRLFPENLGYQNYSEKLVWHLNHPFSGKGLEDPGFSLPPENEYLTGRVIFESADSQAPIQEQFATLSDPGFLQVDLWEENHDTTIQTPESLTEEFGNSDQNNENTASLEVREIEASEAPRDMRSKQAMNLQELSEKVQQLGIEKKAYRFIGRVCRELVDFFENGVVFVDDEVIPLDKFGEAFEITSLGYQHGVVSRGRGQLSHLAKEGTDINKYFANANSVAWILDSKISSYWKMVKNKTAYYFVSTDNTEMADPKIGFLLMATKYLKRRFKKANYTEKDYKVSIQSMVRACFAESILDFEEGEDKTI